MRASLVKHLLAASVLAASGTMPAFAQAAPAGKSAADVRFMQGMIAHHAQAVEMVALMASRTTTPAMMSLGERISVSQRDEIAMMQQWLREHHELSLIHI